MKLSDFQYDLPPERIAQQPAEPRDSSRLMVLDGAGGIAHHRFLELDRLLRPGDVLVANATRVFPARLRGRKKTGGKVEVLLLGTQDSTSWRALVRGATQPTVLIFQEGVEAVMEQRLSRGEWHLRFTTPDVRAFVERHGEMPLPPYIKRPERAPQDRERYQTVYAKSEGAVAAPTAGFHFTPDLLERLKQKGVQWLEVVLHVGWGTFRPIREEDISRHEMLPERYEISAETAKVLNEARAGGRRIIGIGTTVVRTLETVADDAGVIHHGRGESDLFIIPGYRFKSIDALITNFHLPDSTPLLLANAFYGHKMSQGNRTGENAPFVLRKAYREAIRAGYRFYSYGDAMFIQ